MSAQPNSTSVASPGRRVKFVAVDTTRGGLPVKRKQVQHACDSCRRKKRRCVHAHDSATAADESTPDRTPKAVTQSSNTSHQTLSAGKRNSSSSDATAIADQPASEPPPAAAALGPSPVTVDSQTTGSPAVRSRFFGDLNPEGMFLEAAGSVASREVISKGDVGVWLTSAGVGNGTSQFITARPPLAMDRVLLPFVKKHFLCLFPQNAIFRN
uniref:Zn(2)-C6 fungal-type domain-containing protein n=1 Tax=Bionectria ochroleuca TaxID=29856 RepID=A0A8H7TQU0_BIOOC